MKIKGSKKKESSSSSKKSSNRTSKAVDDHLEEEIHVWAGDSFTSIASSVTAPPSQTASFYKKVLGGYGDDDFESDGDDSDHGSSVQDNHTNRSSDDDDNLSWADNRSRTSSNNGGDSTRATTKKKGKKKKKFKKKITKLFGGAIQEDHDAETEDQPPPRRARRLSLFGNHSGHGPENMVNNSEHEVSRYSSTDGEVSVNHSDDDPPTNWSQNGSNDDVLGYEEAEPSIGRYKVKRRGSLGAFFAKKEEQHEQNSTAGTRGRRASLTGMLPSSNHTPPDEEDHDSDDKPIRRRRNSLFGSMSKSDHMPSKKPDQDMAHGDNSLAASTTHNSGKRRGRRSSLTGGNYNRSSMKSMGSTSAPPKDIHWVVNQERKARGMPPFDKSILLDTLAKSMANEMSLGLPPTPTEFYGNVGRGKSLQDIHTAIMDDRNGISRKNILSERFTEFGMAVTPGNDGQLYMIALFKE